MSDTQQPLPPRLPKNFLNQFGKLSHDQAGHLRHFHNLATRRDGDWGPMGSQEPGQEWLDAYRYQLATMAYAAGVAHYHRLPALRSPFKSLMECLIRKMLRREVWGYWFLTSHSGIFVDPDIEELRKPWADPIARENIMVHFLYNISHFHIGYYVCRSRNKMLMLRVNLSTLATFYLWSRCIRCFSMMTNTMRREPSLSTGARFSGEWDQSNSPTHDNPCKGLF
jgi:hypothetical protein